MKRALLAFALLLVIILGGILTVSYLMLDRIVHAGIETIGPDATGATIKVDSVNISPLSGTIGLSMLTVGNPEGYSADRSLFVRDLKARVDMVSLLTGVVIVEEVLIDGASITWEGLRGDNHRQIMKNMDRYAARFRRPGAREAPTARMGGTDRKVIVRNVYLQNSSMDIVARGNSLVTVSLPPMHMTDIGGDTGGESAGEVIRDTYRQLYTAMGRAARDNGGFLRQTLDEIGDRGQNLIDRTRESTRDLRKNAAEKLEKLWRGLKDLFR